MKTEIDRVRERLTALALPVTESGCHIWMGDLNGAGYGVFSSPLSRTPLVHRLVMEMSIGMRLPRSLTVDHLCRVRCCINPDHLELVSASENSKRVHRRR